MNLHVHLHHDTRLDEILAVVKSIAAKENKMDADLQAIITQAKANTDAEAAANAALIALFTKLTAALAGTGPLSASDRAALQDTVKSMSDSATTLAAAIVANTPAA